MYFTTLDVPRKNVPVNLVNMDFSEVPDGSVFWLSDGDGGLFCRKLDQGRALMFSTLTEFLILHEKPVRAFEKLQNDAPRE